MTRIATETLTMLKSKTTIKLILPSTTLRGELEEGTFFVYCHRPDQVYMSLVTLSLVRPVGPIDMRVSGQGRGDWLEAQSNQPVIVVDAAFTRSEV